MYTANFNNKQKELFLELCIHAALSNKVFAGSQKSVIEAYCNEMGITWEKSYEPHEKLETVLSEIQELSSLQVRKMVLSEILSVLIADGVIDDDENDFINTVVTGLDIPKESANEILDSCVDIMNAYNELNRIINI